MKHTNSKFGEVGVSIGILVLLIGLGAAPESSAATLKPQLRAMHTSLLALDTLNAQTTGLGGTSHAAEIQNLKTWMQLGINGASETILAQVRAQTATLTSTVQSEHNTAQSQADAAAEMAAKKQAKKDAKISAAAREVAQAAKAAKTAALIKEAVDKALADRDRAESAVNAIAQAAGPTTDATGAPNSQVGGVNSVKTETLNPAPTILVGAAAI